MVFSSTWLRVDADDVPILATVRCTDNHSQQIIGVVIDVMRQHTTAAFIVRDLSGHHHAVPTANRIEIRDDST